METRLNLGWSVRAALCGLVLSSMATMSATAGEKKLRHPTSLVLSHDDATLYTANRLTGSISVVDVRKRTVVGEIEVAKQFSDLTAVGGTSLLLATDEAQHNLVILQADGSKVTVQHRLPVSPYPVTVVVTDDGRQCIVASLWSRRLNFVELPGDGRAEPRVIKVLDMPFAPRTQLLVKDDTKLIVADSFGGRMAVVDMRKQDVEHVREFPGHNIRGLGVSPNGEMLIVAHQMLNELAHTVRNDVHWGLLMSNDLRWLKLDSVLQADTDLYAGAHMHPLGEAGSATGDPAGLTVTSRGAVVVSLGGVAEIAVGKEDDFSLYRIHVDRRPTAVVSDSDGAFVYTANSFDDTISVVDIAEREEVATISLGKQRELSLVEQGERLFYNANLSHDSWMSCHSCHTDGHTNGLLNDNFSDASFGAPKRVLSLLGRSDTAPFAWAGTAETLEAQIRKSLVHTMQADEPPTNEQLTALAAYVTTLAAPPAIEQVRGVQDRDSVDRGRELFTALNCVNCHKPPVFTTPDTYDVGIDDKLGKNKFNPPTLLGVGQRGPYFHDNRAVSLEEVLLKYKHQLERAPADGELKDLLSFLRSL